MLPRAGDLMVGYRYRYGRASGNLVRGSSSASDADVAALGCRDLDCSNAPQRMSMHMLHLMYAPTD